METRLISQKEKRYFAILLTSSLLMYFLFLISIIGIFILLFLFLIPLVIFLLSLGQIRTNGVKVTKKQFPSIHHIVERTAEKMNISTLPDVYIVQSEGALNAFASKFFQKNMIVIYSELADLVVENREKELSFVIAHELAHIKRNHVLKQLLLLPGNWIPFLGSAYSRACEYTCDAMAGHYISDLEASKKGLAILAVGKKLSHEVDLNEYLLEASKEDNLICWLSEKLSSHPNLPKRIANIQNRFCEPYHIQFTASLKIKLLIAGLATFGFLVVVGGVFGVQAFQKTSLYSDFMLGTEETTPLMLAVNDGEIDKVEELLKQGVDINAVDTDGWTALHYALSWQDFEAEDIDELVETDTNIQMVKLLLENGADPNAKDQYGDSVVSYATSQGFFESVKLLIKQGADLNIADEFGETPLFDAVYMEDSQMVQLLLDNDAKVNVENADGQTVTDIAIENDYEEILTILKSKQ
jgi:Zn-dependent protease with chaperone function